MSKFVIWNIAMCLSFRFARISRSNGKVYASVLAGFLCNHYEHLKNGIDI